MSSPLSTVEPGGGQTGDGFEIGMGEADLTAPALRHGPESQRQAGAHSGSSHPDQCHQNHAMARLQLLAVVAR